MKIHTFILVLTAVLLASCETTNRAHTNKFNRSPGDMAGIANNYGFFYEYDESPFRGNVFNNKETPKPILPDTQKIVYNARLTLKVANTDTTAAQLINLAKQSGGYVQTTSNGYVVMKVPSFGLNNVIKEIETYGKVTYKNIVADDITEAYYDAQTRLENLDKARQRYLDLLGKAQTVEEMLKVEKELERVNGEMEVLKGKLARMNNSVQYSTITVYIDKKVKPGILGYPFVWAYKGISWLFVRK